MGDIADHHLDQMFADGSWGMALPRKRKPVCKHCGKTGLNWRQIKGRKWRLHEKQTLHDCMNQPTAEGFTDEPV